MAARREPQRKNHPIKEWLLRGGCEGIRTLDLLRDRETC